MPPTTEFHIFRDARRRTSRPQLVEGVRQSMGGLVRTASLDAVLTLLLQAGEMECALSDAGAPLQVCARAAGLTGLFAEAAVAWNAGDSLDSRQIAEKASSILDGIEYSGPLSIGVPEGFAYYALHPLDYADLIARSQIDAPAAMVVGVRSIGTTLSAVVAAKLRATRNGCPSRRDEGICRLTVRPSGHPYDRQCTFDPAQRSRIANALASDAAFLVCDEGPGRSGSSLLSVAEALEREGVPRHRILILCAYAPSVAALCAPDAAERWQRYRVEAAGMTRRLPSDAAEYLGSGQWRRKLFGPSASWPASWPQMERLRYGSPDGRFLLTFEGHGPYGAAVRDRQQALSDAGFALPYLGQEAGFGRLQRVQGTAVMPEQASPEILTGLAEYCAWRGRAFAVSDTDSPQLELTARINYEREFGIALDRFVLSVERPTICDSRMMPQEWLRADDGRLFKLNAAIHGDDHFFPGPCDIAWDLAGVVVEWNLSPGARERFLAEYRRASGDDPLPRMSAYETAYATFRMAWSAMAAGSAGGAEEELRLIRNYTKYRDIQRGAASAAPLTPLLHLSSLGTARDDDSESDLARQAGGSYRL